jgi:uncharacterized protein (TIGR02246 family)
VSEPLAFPETITRIRLYSFRCEFGCRAAPVRLRSTGPQHKHRCGFTKPQPTVALTMKKLLLLVLLGLIALPVARADQKEDDAAIHKRHDEWSAAWNKHDAKLMASFFFADGDLINPFGRHCHGTAEIEKLFSGEHGTAMAGTIYSGTIESIRYLGKIAMIDVAGEVAGMKGPDGVAAPPFKHHVTWIAEKKGGKWFAHGARAFAFLPPPGTAPK